MQCAVRTPGWLSSSFNMRTCDSPRRARTPPARISARTMKGTTSRDARSKVSITYDAAKKSTTIAVQNGGTATIEGADFMKATWSVWFGKIDQASLSDQLIKALP